MQWLEPSGAASWGLGVWGAGVLRAAHPFPEAQFSSGVGPVDASWSGKPETAKGKGRHGPGSDHPWNRGRTHPAFPFPLPSPTPPHSYHPLQGLYSSFQVGWPVQNTRLASSLPLLHTFLMQIFNAIIC